ncbi:unnamed protein product [Mytilus edulis]|uniref:Mutator-like transposase domain-containing protein n=1 Tax=Mytilus edulis TaxID=6550 RepID=A0A8S3PU67_MYTED|nr:unnamed protein product [Mytilus edulis]
MQSAFEGYFLVQTYFFLREIKAICQKPEDVYKILPKRGWTGGIDQDDKDITWKDGRRLVDLSLLAEALKACVGCGSNLKLHNTINEQRFGFASILNISCEQCGYLTAIPTSKRHFTGQRGPGAFDINTKMALGMTDCGSGHRQLNKLFATIGVPGISANALKTRKEEVNKPLVETAKKSCLEAIEEETALTL